VLTGVAGLALVLASQAMMNAFQSAASLKAAALTPEALSIPFIVTFLLLIGMRIVFEIPVEIRANWIFQLMLDTDRQECERLARTVMLTSVLPWLLVLTFAAYCYLEGVVVASLHVLVILIWSVLLTNVLLIRFRKLPFTCSLPVFKQHSIVILIALCFGFLIYAGSTAEYEASALAEPVKMLGLLPVVLIAWFIPRYLGNNTIELERKLIFEETAVRTVEALRLSD